MLLSFSQKRAEEICNHLPSVSIKASAAAGGGEGPKFAFIYPNFMINKYELWMDTFTTIPLGVDKCRVHFDYYVHKSKVRPLLALDVAQNLSEYTGPFLLHRELQVVGSPSHACMHVCYCLCPAYVLLGHGFLANRHQLSCPFMLQQPGAGAFCSSGPCDNESISLAR